ncbi:MAG: hypothetical protein MMC33_010500 [Icmadophila ericetorum]|nr:hypothetical protein [Icmadophila ericetorum]
MGMRSPCLVWVDSKEDEHERGYFNPKLDQLLIVPGHSRYIGRNLICVGGNSLRGRKTNQDTLNIWYLDDDPIPNLVTNQSIHGTVPTLIGDTWGEFIWKGPLVAVLKVGSTRDPRLLTDITLTAYRDAIDYLGYYRDTIGSMIDGIGMRDHLAKRILEDRARKVWGVRINCIGDQNRGEPELVRVAVPKTHPLFNLEGDDPFDIPDRLDRQWVAKAYSGKSRKSSPGEAESDLVNPLARLLLLQTSVENGKWVGLRPWWHDSNIGSILVVARRFGDVEVDEVMNICRFIQQRIVPLMTDERALTLEGRQEVLAAITEENLAVFLES